MFVITVIHGKLFIFAPAIDTQFIYDQVPSSVGKRSIQLVLPFQITHIILPLCSWHVVVSMPEDGEEEKEELDLPHSLRHLGECTFYDVMHLDYLIGLSWPHH